MSPTVAYIGPNVFIIEESDHPPGLKTRNLKKEKKCM